MYFPSNNTFVNHPIMKYWFFLAFFFTAFLGQAQEDAIVTHFDGYLQDEAYTSVYVSPKMFSVIATMDVDQMAPEVRKLLDQLTGMRVVQRPGDGTATYKEATQKLTGTKYDELMSLREKGEQVRFYTKGPGREVDELLMVVGGPNRFLMLSMVGKIDINTVSKLAKHLNLEGVDMLQRVKK